MVGGSSLLVIFAVLCLVMLAMLSLSTVSADLRLAEKSRELVEDFYAADSEAEGILARLRNGELPEGVSVEEKENGLLCRYQCEISSTQSLAVEVLVDGRHYEIRRWQVISTTKFEIDDSLPVWNGFREGENSKEGAA